MNSPCIKRNAGLPDKVEEVEKICRKRTKKYVRRTGDAKLKVYVGKGLGKIVKRSKGVEKNRGLRET